MSRRARLVAAVLAAIAIFGSIAQAGGVSVQTAGNNVVATTVAGGDTFVAGSSTTYAYKIVAKQGEACTATPSTPVKVTVVAPPEVTVTYPAPAPNNPPLTFLTFTACDDPGSFPPCTPLLPSKACDTSKKVMFSSGAVGSYAVSAMVDGGADANSQPIPYDTSAAEFTLKVLVSGLLSAAGLSPTGNLLVAGGSADRAYVDYAYKVLRTTNANRVFPCVLSDAPGQRLVVELAAPPEITIAYLPIKDPPVTSLTFTKCDDPLNVRFWSSTPGDYAVTATILEGPGSFAFSTGASAPEFTLKVSVSGSLSAAGDGTIISGSSTDYVYEVLRTPLQSDPGSADPFFPCVLNDAPGGRLVVELVAPPEITIASPTQGDPPLTNLTFASCHDPLGVRFKSSTPGVYEITATILEGPGEFVASTATITVRVVTRIDPQGLAIGIDTKDRSTLFSVPVLPRGLDPVTVGPVAVDPVKVGPVTVGPVRVDASVTVGPVDDPRYPDAVVDTVTGTASFDTTVGTGVIVQMISPTGVEIFTGAASLACNNNASACTWSFRIPFVVPPGEYKLEATASQPNAATSKVRDSVTASIRITVL